MVVEQVDFLVAFDQPEIDLIGSAPSKVRFDLADPNVRTNGSFNRSILGGGSITVGGRNSVFNAPVDGGIYIA